MLVGGFEIHIGRITQLGMQRAHGFVRHAAVDPNINCIVALGCPRRKTKFARKIDIA